MNTATPDVAVLEPSAAGAKPPRPAPEPIADRAFLMSMARIPFLALLWAGAAWGLSLVAESVGLAVDVREGGELLRVNVAPLAVIAFGMLLAAAIDGYAFKVPNWVTLALVVSGWYLGLLHDFGAASIPGSGGVFAALFCTAIGFLTLFPLLAIGGMGQGDVKMTMGFGSWMGAFFGLGVGAKVLLWSFAVGAIVGGIFGIVMIVLRRQVQRNVANTKEIAADLKVLATEGQAAASRRANARRASWVRLPYGVPLCVGFLGYLAYLMFLPH